jgi:hypothetical protein
MPTIHSQGIRLRARKGGRAPDGRGAPGIVGLGRMCLADGFDDGGLSGATMERPALQHLLAEIQAGRVNIVSVYKVDRLTRSLVERPQP